MAPVKFCTILVFAAAAAFAGAAVPGQDAPLEERLKAAFVSSSRTTSSGRRGPSTTTAARSPSASRARTWWYRGARAGVLPGRKVGERSMVVRRLAADATSSGNCQILFIGGSVEADRAAELLRQSKGKPVLTVTESADGAPLGIINFLTTEGRIRFDIAMDAANRNGLRLRAPLLAVARKVKTS